MIPTPRRDGSIGQIVKRLRKRARMKQQVLADALGIDRTTLSRIETDQRLPSDYQRECLAEALGCTLAELRGG